MTNEITITEEQWHVMTIKCENCEHVLTRHLDTQQELSPCVVTYCRCSEFVEPIESDVVSVVMSRQRAEWLYHNHEHPEDTFNCAVCEAFAKALFEREPECDA